MTKAKGSSLCAIRATARRRAAGSASAVVGKGSCSTSITDSSFCVIWPISLCCGSSPMPGWPRHVVISSVGMRKGVLSEVSGLTALPRPEFWHMTTVFRPASQAPAAIATASPSLAAPT